MFDPQRALADMASQIRTCRSQDGLTLQQLATQSGVAASTIHKVESQQMVPTVSVLLKIARGLGRRPEELIRDELSPPATQPAVGPADPTRPSGKVAPANGASAASPLAALNPNAIGIWRIVLDPHRALPGLDLEPRQRASLLIEQGEIDLHTRERQVHLEAGDCVEIEGSSIRSANAHTPEACLTLIVSPLGDLAARLGAPHRSRPLFP